MCDVTLDLHRFRVGFVETFPPQRSRSVFFGQRGNLVRSASGVSPAEANPETFVPTGQEIGASSLDQLFPIDHILRNSVHCILQDKLVRTSVVTGVPSLGEHYLVVGVAEMILTLVTRLIEATSTRFCHRSHTLELPIYSHTMIRASGMQPRKTPP